VLGKNHVLQGYMNADAYGSPLLNCLKYTHVETPNTQCLGSCCHQLPWQFQFFKKGKGKSVPLQATGPRHPVGSRKLRFPDYMTMAQMVVVSLTHQPLLPPGNTPGTHFC